jgi:hypothetical protein
MTAEAIGMGPDIRKIPLDRIQAEGTTQMRVPGIDPTVVADWDNVVGTFDSASMAAALTSANYTDRVLGKSECVLVPNKAILLMTGNNLTLAGDMARRVLVCRIDPRTDQPFAREFDLDPLAHTLAHRQEMVAAALTIIRGWLTSGADPRR